MITYPHFQQNLIDVGRCGIYALVKCTSAIHQLAYGFVPDSLDEFLQIGTKTARDCIVNFSNGIMELYGEEYLRKPTQTDIEKLYAYHEEKHGFPGSFILLEAVASLDLWIWHAFFSVAGSNNDINVIRQSPLLNNLKEGKASKVAFVANDVHYKWGYYLINDAHDMKRIRYKQVHEAARKDVERRFDVLKKKWKEYKFSQVFFWEEHHREDDPMRSEENRLQDIRDINDSNAYLSLKADLVEHLWHRENEY
ncbi:ALP1-like protein [Tanacetum coccineum]|uniref:ALP1-like protein n=1 Tax=Tanacetum coccineum TaxID=301880 RepID=A0ABQ4ZKR8_9ASTR